MRRLLAIGLVVAGAAGAVLVAWVMALTVQPRDQATTKAACVSTVGVTSGGGSGGKTLPLDTARKNIVGRIISVGKERKLSPRAWQIALQAGSAESSLQNLTYGDRDSLGIFQMRPSMGWGSPSQLHDIDYQINKFYSVLSDVAGWESMQPGDAAQAVEGSGFPDRYNDWEGFAVGLVKKNGKVHDASGCSGLSLAGGKIAKTVIEAARKYLGTPYAWGGGTPDGPSSGIAPDQGVVGFDCSSLVQYAYAKAGITLPRQSAEQYNAGKHVPWNKRKPGDLVFWADASGNPEAIHHVAIYLGGNKVIQAPQSGDHIKISTVWASERVKMVTRPLAK